MDGPAIRNKQSGSSIDKAAQAAVIYSDMKLVACKNWDELNLGCGYYGLKSIYLSVHGGTRD